MDNVEYAIYKIPNKEERPPTRICSICDFKEDPKATLAHGLAWICPECARRIKKLIYPEKWKNVMGNAKDVFGIIMEDVTNGRKI